MTEQKKKVVKTVRVTFEEFTDYDFIPCGSFFIRDATGDYLFFKTSDRQAAQQESNNLYGVSKYTVVAAKLDKTPSRLESGGLSVYATATRQVKR